jgi:AraC-like DNA-binding protein
LAPDRYHTRDNKDLRHLYNVLYWVSNQFLVTGVERGQHRRVTKADEQRSVSWVPLHLQHFTYCSARLGLAKAPQTAAVRLENWVGDPGRLIFAPGLRFYLVQRARFPSRTRVPMMQAEMMNVADPVVCELTRAIENLVAGKQRSADTCLVRAWHLPHTTSKPWTSQCVPPQADISIATARRGGLAPWQVRRIAAHIDGNLNSTITVHFLAKLARLSHCHFSRAFKASFGSPPHQYVMLRRTELAQAMILQTESSLSQIALDCGLADQAHLTRLFRRIVGITPRAWQRAQPRGAPQ